MSGRIVVCVKWVEVRAEVDPLTGAVAADPRGRGASAADRAALEVGLRLGEARGAVVELVTAGPVGAEAMLAELGACGASRLVRAELDPDADSATVARALAAVASGADLVVCGDHSPDRGSGAVPVFVAHHLGVAAACGLTAVEPADDGGLRAVRRLGGGRSERVRIAPPAVLSVEGAVATLRRAPLAAVLAAGDRHVEVRPRPATADPRVRPGPLRPWRPPVRVVPPPGGESARERIVTLTGALVERTPPRTVDAEPAEAADAIVEQLRAWGHLS